MVQIDDGLKMRRDLLLGDDGANSLFPPVASSIDRIFFWGAVQTFQSN